MKKFKIIAEIDNIYKVDEFVEFIYQELETFIQEKSFVNYFKFNYKMTNYNRDCELTQKISFITKNSKIYQIIRELIEKSTLKNYVKEITYFENFKIENR